MSTVAVIGVGRMGGPIARHLVAAGHAVRVYDVDATAAAATGATIAPSPAAAADGAAFVAVVVFDDAQALAVVPATVSAVAPASVVAVHTTVTTATIETLAAGGAPVIDAGISGGEPSAQAGTLLTMVGGDAGVVEQARPFMTTYSSEVIHAGPLGAGMALKLARNATGYAMMAAVHEAMELAAAAGVDASVLQHVISRTGVLDQALAPFALAHAAPEMLEHLDRLGAKDLEAALHLGRALDVPVEVMEATRGMFSRVAHR